MTSRAAAGAAVAALLLAACTPVQVQETAAPEPEASATFPEGGEPTGPVVELGTGQALDRQWRYSIYPAGEDWCTQLETGLVTSTACGDPLPAEDEVFGAVGRGEVGEGVTSVEGTVIEEVVTVWIVLDDGRQAPAILMPLDAAGLEGQAFVGLVPPGNNVSHLLAVAMSGEILETHRFADAP